MSSRGSCIGYKGGRAGREAVQALVRARPSRSLARATIGRDPVCKSERFRELLSNLVYGVMRRSTVLDDLHSSSGFDLRLLRARRATQPLARELSCRKVRPVRGGS